MLKYIIKRNKEKQDFNPLKIYNAIFRAVAAVATKDNRTNVDTARVQAVTDDVVAQLQALNLEAVDIEDVQDIVESSLIKHGHDKTAKAYILYRQKQAEKREMNRDIVERARNIFRETDKLNANIVNSPMGKMLQLGELVSKEYARTCGFPKEFMQAHDNGDIHIHDIGFAFLTVNCLHIPAKRLLHDGFDNGHGFIRPPKRIGSAAALAAILIQSSQNDMFGGQSIPSFDAALAPFAGPDIPEDEVFQAMESLVFNLNTMHSRAGAQVPFSSLNIGLDTSEAGRRISRNLLLAYQRGLGRGENPVFPNVIFKVKRGVNRDKGDPNYDLFKLAMQVAAKRMNPTFAFMDSTFNAPLGDVDIMGCRTRVANNVNGPQVGEGRGNLFFVSLNLPRIGILAEKSLPKFWELLDDRMELCCRHLMNRYDIVKQFKVSDLPFVMKEGLYLGSENLSPDDTIEDAIKQGTMAMGFIGLAETLVALLGKHHGESEEALSIGLAIVQRMKAKMDEMTKKTHLNFSLFATPGEGLSGRFTKIDNRLFGSIPGVTDREYYTNSFHIPVYFPISHHKKISIEGQFHKYCLGGHISYVEYEAPPFGNLVALEKELNHMADSDIGYAGINFPIDFCADCGFQSVINEDECPICGSSHIVRLRRITGYLSDLKNFNDGKKAEEKDRTKS